MGSWSVGNYLRGIGDTKSVLQYGFLDIFTIPLAYIMTVYFGPVGLISSSYILSPIVYIYTMYILKNKYKIIFDWQSSLKISFISVIDYILSYLILNSFEINIFIKVIFTGILFILIYGAGVIYTKLVTKKDLSYVKLIIENDPFIWTFIKMPYMVIEKIVSD